MESILVSFKDKSDFDLVFNLLQKMELDFKVIQETDALKLLIDENETKLSKDQFIANFEQALIEVKDGETMPLNELFND